jgi:hypothetical protein
MQAGEDSRGNADSLDMNRARTTDLVGIDDIGLPGGIAPENGQSSAGGHEPREDVDRLERAAGPHGARTTELVGVDDIGLPSGIQPEDVTPVSAMAAGGQGQSQGGQGQSQGGGDAPPAPVPVHESSPEVAPGDDAPAGTVGTGDDVCPICHGSGKNASGGQCPNCYGTGKITEGIGGG